MKKAIDSNVCASGSVSIGVMHGEGGFIFDESYYFDPEHRWQQDLEIARWCERKFSPYPIYNAEAHLVQLHQQPYPYRQVGGLQPNLIMGAALGSNLIFPGNTDPDISAVSKLSLAEGDQYEWKSKEPVKTFLTQIDFLNQKYSHQDVDVYPPFFWDRSGRATIHGPLTTAVKLFGEDFFTLPYTDFKYAEKIIQWITTSYLKLIQIFAGSAGINFNDIHIGECSGSLFPPDIWESLAVPAMKKLADAAGSVRIHSCGRSDHLFDQIKRVDHLTCLNIGSGSSLKLAREKFGTDLKIDLIPAIHLLNDGQVDDIKLWIDQCLSENDDGPLHIQFHYDIGMPFKNIKRIFDTLDAYGVSFTYDSLVARWVS